mmetsp:Transcript_8973/g.10134  ORF Transcript_8973/g.10134 Transcript_8973/m.10134 type:complete len:205 (-) Transcript_8973:306-920(-)
MSNFFGDFMRDHDDFFTKEFSIDNAFAYTAKYERTEDSGKVMTSEHKVTLNSGDAEKEFAGYKVGTEVKVKVKDAKWKSEMSLSPSTIKCDKEINIDQLSHDDAVGSAYGKFEHKVGKDKPDLTIGVNYSNKNLHENVGVWLQNHWTYAGLSEVKGKHSFMFAYNNQFFVGSQILADYKTKKTDEILGLVAVKHDGNLGYFSAN